METLHCMYVCVCVHLSVHVCVCLCECILTFKFPLTFNYDTADELFFLPVLVKSRSW